MGYAQKCGYNDRQSIPMISSKKILILCLIFIHATQAFAQSSFVYEYCENGKGNYTTNSTYKANLNRILSILPLGDGNGNGFHSWSSSFYGQFDEIYVVGLCRGDVEPDICRSCLNQSTHLLTQVCPNQKQAIGGFDECMLRYSNQSSFGVMSTHPRFNLWNTLNVSSNYADGFLQHLRTLLNSLKNQASFGGSQMKFETGNTSTPGFQNIYAFVQCTPDLSQPDCNNCLEEAFGDIPQRKAWTGGRVVAPSCNFRYEVYPFNQESYVAPPTSHLQSTVVLRSSQSSSNTGTTKGKKSNKSRTIIIAVVPSVAVVGLIISIGVYTRVKKSTGNRRIEGQSSEAAEEVGCSKCSQFEYNTVKRATNDFSQANKIGSGGFGDFYRGRLPHGQEIAVQRLKGVNLKNVLQISSKLQHRNLVRILGFSVKRDERFLVYEYVPNKSLDRFIFDQPNVEQTYLDWDKRHKIIKGVARGLLYLHEDYPLTIIHRDIKPSNILLDEDMNPKISGFELAKLLGADQTEDITEIAGTPGYVAPECLLRGVISVKTDVFSFGVLLLETLCGRRRFCSGYNFADQDLITAIRRNWGEGTASDLIDPRIINGPEHEVTRCVQIGLLCVQGPRARPTMNVVVHMLNCNSLSLPVPLLYWQFPESGTQSGRSSGYLTDATDYGEIKHLRVTNRPFFSVRVAVLCLIFITKLYDRAYIPRPR